MTRLLSGNANYDYTEQPFSYEPLSVHIGGADYAHIHAPKQLIDLYNKIEKIVYKDQATNFLQSSDTLRSTQQMSHQYPPPSPGTALLGRCFSLLPTISQDSIATTMSYLLRHAFCALNLLLSLEIWWRLIR